MVEKIIHYVWLGDEKSLITKAAIKNWKTKLSSEWKIIEWNEKNIPMDIPFVSYWIKKKNYAFVSDFVGMYVVEKYGGIYMDTDMFIQKPIPKKWLNGELCIPRTTRNWYGLAFFIAQKNNKILKLLIEIYQTTYFKNNDNYKKLVYSLLITQIMHDIFGKNNMKENCHLGNIFILPHNEVQLDYEDGQNIIKHFFAGAWYPEDWSKEEIKNIKEGRYYFLEKKVFAGNVFARLKFWWMNLFIKKKYKSILRKNKDIDVLINKLKNEIISTKAN